MVDKVKIYIPDDSSAISVGADDVAQRVAEMASAQNVAIDLIRTGSRGMFWLEPMIEVETGAGRVAYGPVTISDVDRLFKADFTSGGDHSLALGLVADIPYLAKQDRVTFARCGIAAPLDLAAYKATDGFKGFEAALKRPQADVVADILASGLRGRGGAGFPAGIKWQTVMQAEAKHKYICCNADEGDSGTFADRMLMEGDPFQLLEGMMIAGYAVGAEVGYIYIRSEYPAAIDKIKGAVEVLQDAGLLGSNILGTDFSFNIKIRRGAGAYICGEETSMLDSLEGKRGMVRSKPPIPALSGLFGMPTLVNNVLTLAAVPSIMADGPEAYYAFGQGRARGTQPFQLAGNIKHGGLVELAYGVTLRELIEGYGGDTKSGRPVRAIQLGGPLGAYVSASALDTPMDYEALGEIGAMLGHGGIVVFDDSVDMAQQAAFAMEFCAVESCGKCTPCRIGSVRGRETIEKIIAGECPSDNMALLTDLCDIMEAGSLCAMGGLTPMPVKSAITHFAEDFTRSDRGQEFDK